MIITAQEKTGEKTNTTVIELVEVESHEFWPKTKFPIMPAR